MRRAGLKALQGLEYLGLVIITVATLVAAGQDVTGMVLRGHVELADLLLLFIYLEVLAMVAMYMESGKLPVRMPLYIGIVALARYLVLDIKAMDEKRLLAVAAAILLIALGVLLLRYAQSRFADVETRRNTWSA